MTATSEFVTAVTRVTRCSKHEGVRESMLHCDVTRVTGCTIALRARPVFVEMVSHASHASQPILESGNEAR